MVARTTAANNVHADHLTLPGFINLGKDRRSCCHPSCCQGKPAAARAAFFFLFFIIEARHVVSKKQRPYNAPNTVLLSGLQVKAYALPCSGGVSGG